MTPALTFAGRKVALFGLGGSGLASARALAAGGAEVSAWDDNSASRDKAAASGIPVVDLNVADWRAFDSLLLSPGVPLTHPQPHWTVLRAREVGVEVIGDIEVFCRERARLAPGSPFVAITGTNGKSTTTALVAHILRGAGKDVQMGGNIGVAILALEPPAPGRYHVIECSSFQIDLAPSLRPGVGVLLNLTGDHLDRHGDMATYAGVKQRLVEAADFSVIGVDDHFCARIYAQCAARPAAACVPVSQHMPTLPGAVRWRDAEGREQLVEARHEGARISPGGMPNLRGAHNWQNAAAAYSVCAHLGVAHDDIVNGLITYPGLPHRMEVVAQRNRVLVVNDSKATNADATEKALLSYNDIFWIAGGQPKAGGIEPLRALFGRVRKAYLIGEASDAFARTLQGAAPYEACVTLDAALERAARDALASEAAEPVVLLSPACASYDQFANFEARGNRFRELAQALPSRTANA